MVLLPDIGYPQTGDTAGSSFYACMNCPHDGEDNNSIVYLDKIKKLPECPVCGYAYWIKV